MNPHIAFLGGGNMANAIIGGMIKQGFHPSRLSVVEHNANTRDKLTEQFHISCHESVSTVQNADIWVLAVKPQNMRDALAELTPLLHTKQMLVSIAAGLTTATLTSWSGNHRKIARTMPNTPAMVGQGVTGIFAPASMFNTDEQIALDSIFKTIGSTVWLDTESQIDSITAISGSGPAYVFYMMEHLAAAAVELGFDSATADLLVKQTFAGAVALANTSEDSLSTLREKVTSKGGTTAAALNAFSTHELDKALHQGAQAAFTRAQELAIELAK
jgi:pyrroline-5-carboxylate reductase